MTMIFSFLFGFFTALACVVGGVVFIFYKLNEHVAGSVTAAAVQRAESRSEVEAAATLDPIKVLSKVQFGTFDAVAAVPPRLSLHPLRGGGGSARERPSEEARLLNYNRAAGRSLRYGRIALVGTTISVYETVIVDRNGLTRPIKEKLRHRKKIEGGLLSSSSPSNGSPGGGSVGSGGGSPMNILSSSGAFDVRSGSPATERLVGKISTAHIVAHVETLHDSDHPPTGTASVGTRYLVLRYPAYAYASGATTTGGGAVATTADPPGSCEGADSGYTLPPQHDGADEGDGVQQWLAAQLAGAAGRARVVSLNAPPLFAKGGGTAETKQGVVTLAGGGGAAADGRKQRGGGEIEVAAFAYHDDTPARWRSLMIRFATVRELERWLEVLQPTVVTNQWKLFLKSLPEIDTLNVFASRIFFENRELGELNELVKEKINKALHKVVLPAQLAQSSIAATAVSVGGELPIFSNISPIATSACGEIAVDLNVWYRGGFTCTLTIDMKLKTDRILKMDISAPSFEVTVRLRELRGRLHVSIGAPPSRKMWLGFHELPEVDVEISIDRIQTESALAHLVVSAIPDLSELITNIVREKLFEDLTLPHLDDFPVPNVEKTPPPTPRGSDGGGERPPHH